MAGIAAAMLAFGALAWRHYVPGAETAAIPRRAAAFSLATSLLAALCAVVIAAGPVPIPDPAVLWMILTKTTFGRAWLAHLVLGAIFVAAITRRKTPLKLLTILAALNLVSFAPIGHASVGEGAFRLLRLANHGAHLFAGGLWFGALAPLAGAVKRGGAFAVEAVRRFTFVATIAVAIIVATGLANIFAALGTLAIDFQSAYGRWLALKIIIVTALLAFAAFNRFVLSPRGDFAGLRRTIFVEAGLFALILIAAVELAASPPMHG